MFSGKSKERSRARQMIELTSATHHMARIDMRLVAKVLERVDVRPMSLLCGGGVMIFIIRSIRKTKVVLAKRSGMW